MEKQVANFPAYRVLKRDQTREGYVDITADDVLGLKHERGYYNKFKPGSAVSYALQYNECPIASYQDCIARGHETHWIIACASVITSHARPQETLIEVEIGMRVRFEGLIATIEKDGHSNLKFVACT